jgi:hypothetical protein
MSGTQPCPSERMRSSNLQLGTPSGGHPDVTNAVGARRNPLVDIGFDPAETDQQLLPSLPMPSHDNAGLRTYCRANFYVRVQFLLLASTTE